MAHTFAGLLGDWLLQLTDIGLTGLMRFGMEEETGIVSFSTDVQSLTIDRCGWRREVLAAPSRYGQVPALVLAVGLVTPYPGVHGGAGLGKTHENNWSLVLGVFDILEGAFR